MNCKNESKLKTNLTVVIMISYFKNVLYNSSTVKQLSRHQVSIRLPYHMPRTLSVPKLLQFTNSGARGE